MNSLIMARPTYSQEQTPRFDPYRNSGTIRGSQPTELTQTAIGSEYRLYEKNVPAHENFSEKIKKSSNNNNMSSIQFEEIDAPNEMNSQTNFARLTDMNNDVAQANKQSNRPDLSYQAAQLPKLGIENKFKDPTDPTNYMYDRTLFAPLKRRNGNQQTDFIRGDIYVAPNKFGWFDVPSNPGTDLNPGFFNLNYPSVEATVEGQEIEVKRENRGITMAELDAIQRNNPFSSNFLHRP